MNILATIALGISVIILIYAIILFLIAFQEVFGISSVRKELLYIFIFIAISYLVGIIVQTII